MAPRRRKPELLPEITSEDMENLRISEEEVREAQEKEREEQRQERHRQRRIARRLAAEESQLAASGYGLLELFEVDDTSPAIRRFMTHRLVKENIRLVFACTHLYTKRMSEQQIFACGGVEEIQGELMLTLLRAASAWDPARMGSAKFSTFFYQSAFNTVRKMLTSRQAREWMNMGIFGDFDCEGGVFANMIVDVGGDGVSESDAAKMRRVRSESHVDHDDVEFFREEFGAGDGGDDGDGGAGAATTKGKSKGKGVGKSVGGVKFRYEVQQRIALLMLECTPVKDIAATVGMSVGAVKRHITSIQEQVARSVQ